MLDVSDHRVAITAPYQRHRRMTLTYPALSSAYAIVRIVAGEDEAWALESLREADPTIPAGRTAQERAVPLTDENDR